MGSAKRYSLAAILLLAGFVAGHFMDTAVKKSGIAGEMMSPGGGENPLESMEPSVDVRGSEADIIFRTKSTGLAVVNYRRGQIAEGGSYTALASAKVEKGRNTLTLNDLEPGVYSYRITFIGVKGAVVLSESFSFNLTEENGENTDTAGGFKTLSESEDQNKETSIDERGGGESGKKYSSKIEYDKNRQIGGIEVRTSSKNSSGAMEFNLVVEGDSYGPFSVPESGELYEYKVETEGKNFVVDIVERSGPDVEIEEIRLLENVEKDSE